MIRRFGWVLPAAVGLLVVVIGTIRVFSSGAQLIGDRAVLALQVADIAGGQLSAVGLYSWHGWNHPGAVLFYVLVPFHWIASGQSWGIFLGISLISSVCVVLVSWLAFRRRGVVASCGAVMVLMLVWAASGRMTPIDPWTPFVAVSIFVVFMTAVWGVVERDRVAVWVLIFSGAAVVQIHVGYVPLIAVIGLLSLGLYWWTGGNPRATVRPLASSLLLFLPWLTDPRSAIRNVANIADYFINSPEPAVGVVRALRVMSFEFSPEASWVSGPKEIGVIGEAPTATLWWLIAVIVGLLGATVIIYRATHDRKGNPHREGPFRDRLWTLTPVVWISLLIAIVSVTQVRGFLFPYVVLWRTVIALIVLGWIAAVFVTVVRMPRKNLVILATLGLVVAGGVALTPFSRYDTVTQDVVAAESAIDQAIGNIGEDSPDRSSELPGSIIRLKLGDAGLVGLFPALVWELEKRGFASGIDSGTEWVFGDRVLPPGQETVTWFVCDTGIGWSLLSSMPGARIISLVSPFTMEAETRVTALQKFIAEQLRAADRVDALTTLDSPLVALALSDLAEQGLVDKEALEELAAFNILTPEPGRRFGIVAFDPEVVPEIWWGLSVF